MRHRNSVFHDILKLVPWSAFDRLVEAHGTDEGTRRFSSRQNLNALLFAQLSGAGSLREIGATMASHQGRLYHSGALAPKRSTLADANRSRDFRIFSGLFEGMLAQAGRGFRRKMADAVRLIELDRAQACRRRLGMGALLDRRLRSQGACRLRSRLRSPAPPRPNRRQRQRHHGRQGDADRGGRDLCLRPWLL